jgi:energy-coupling factor transporter ATP-binding protein EcfA2
MALSEVLLGHAGIEPNVEVYDEPAHFLSPEGVRDLVELLADRARQLQRTIFYIDHQAVESTRFASVIEVVRDKHGVQIG